jgi:hypothetical protein
MGDYCTGDLHVERKSIAVIGRDGERLARSSPQCK